MKKLRVCWLCRLQSRDTDDFFGVRSPEYIMPFFPLMLDRLAGVAELDIHVILSNRYTNQSAMFERGNITYHFYSFYDESMFASQPPVFHLAGIDYRKKQILALLSRLKPDLVHVHGACFVDFSPAVPDILKRYPTLVSITGFLRNASQESFLNRMSSWFEDNILRSAHNFGTRTDVMEHTIRMINPEAVFHRHPYLTPLPTVIKDNHGVDEPFDGIYFARLVRDKGIYDLLEAIELVCRERPGSKYLIYGQGDEKTVKNIMNYVRELDIEDAIDFRGYQSDTEVIYKAALGAKMCILPTYHDTVPGTVIESMCMKLPVLCYAVGGIPELNRDRRCVGLVEVHDKQGLSAEMIRLLDRVELRKEMAENGYQYAKENFMYDDFAENMTSIYRRVASK